MPRAGALRRGRKIRQALIEGHPAKSLQTTKVTKHKGEEKLSQAGEAQDKLRNVTLGTDQGPT